MRQILVNWWPGILYVTGAVCLACSLLLAQDAIVITVPASVSLAMGTNQSTFTWSAAGPTSNFTFAAPGLFTGNTNWNYPVNATIGTSVVASDIRKSMSAGNAADAAVSGAVIVPVGATSNEADGVSGVIQTSSPTTGSVGVFGGAIATGTGASVWGLNTIAGDVNLSSGGVGAHVPANAVIGYEMDMHVEDSGTELVMGLSIGGGWGGAFKPGTVASYGIALGAINQAGPWGIPLFISAGAGTEIGILLEAQGPCSGPCVNVNSMGITFWAANATGGPEPFTVEADQTAAGVLTGTGGVKIPWGPLSIRSLAGSGNASACLNSDGQFVRGTPGC